MLKVLHQAVLDGGNWSLASSLLPWEDPLGRDVFGGDEDELADAAAWTKSVRELQTQVLKSTTGARQQDVVVPGDGEEVSGLL